MNINRTITGGRLTRSPELRHTTNQTAVAEFTLAINRTFKTESGEKKEDTTFIDVTFWGRKAEVIAEHFQKGNRILVEGRLRQEKWQDKETGKERSKISIVGESFEFVDRKEDA